MQHFDDGKSKGKQRTTSGLSCDFCFVNPRHVAVPDSASCFRFRVDLAPGYR